MIKKITLLMLVVLSTSTTFVSCSSSDDGSENTKENTENNFIPRYEISPPNWLIGNWNDKRWENVYYTFTNDNILPFNWMDWKEAYNFMNQSYWENPSGTLDAHSVSFYDIKETDTYYEAVIKNFRVLQIITVEKISSNEIKVIEKIYDYNGDVEKETEFNCIKK